MLTVFRKAFAAQNLAPPTSIIGSDAYRIGMQLMADSDLLIMVSPALIGVTDAFMLAPTKEALPHR